MTALPIGRRATTDDPLKVGILISGRGSNMEAIINGCQAGDINARVEIVLSNRSDAHGLDIARDKGIPATGISARDMDRDPGNSGDKHPFDMWLQEQLERAQVEVVLLAGYMRILPRWFVDRFEHRILNIHPSLLPSFPGLYPHRQALEHGVKISGCTVHLVDYGVDQGPILLQKAVPVLDDDDEASLAARVLKAEHEIYPEAVRLMASGTLVLQGRCLLERPDKQRKG